MIAFDWCIASKRIRMCMLALGLGHRVWLRTHGLGAILIRRLHASFEHSERTPAVQITPLWLARRALHPCKVGAFAAARRRSGNRGGDFARLPLAHVARVESLGKCIDASDSEVLVRLDDRDHLDLQEAA